MPLWLLIRRLLHYALLFTSVLIILGLLNHFGWRGKVVRTVVNIMMLLLFGEIRQTLMIIVHIPKVHIEPVETRIGH